MVSPQSGQQLYHKSTHLLQLPPQGEADYVFTKYLCCHSSTSVCTVQIKLVSVFPGPKPTQKQLLQQLYNTVPDKWKPIGIYLEVPEAQLKTIDKQHRGNPQECLMAMLTESWLPRVSPPPTWQDLAEAVEFVGYPDVAQKLRNKFCECHMYSVVTIVAFFFNTSCQTCFIVFYRLTVAQSTYKHLKL